jgi:hypothetical protein
MNQITQSTQRTRRVNATTVTKTPIKDGAAGALLIEAKRLLEDRARLVIELGIALGKTIEARASVVLAVDAPCQSAATMIVQTEESIADILKRLDKFLAELYRDQRKKHSEQELERIRNIENRLREPLPSEQWLFNLEGDFPIHLIAQEVAAVAAVTCDWAISVVTIDNLSSTLRRRLETIISIERFIINLGNSLGEKARGFVRLRNPIRRDCAGAVIKGLLGEIRDASRSLADEASSALSFLPASSSAPKPRPKNWSRLPVYHGTSGANLKQILKEGCLRASADQEGAGYAKVSLTLDRSVAEYFACQSALRDAKSPDEAESNAVVLELDGEGLAALFHELNAGEVDWQRELTCCDDIDALDRVLIGSGPVPPERFADYLRLGRKAFMPTSEFKPDDALLINRFILQGQAKSAPKWWS